MISSSDRFLRFAAECQAMAQMSPSRANKAVWNGLAERWLRCAELTEQLDSSLQSAAAAKRHQRRSQHTSH